MFRTSQLFAHLDHPSHLRDDDGVSDDQELLTLAELCTSYNIPRPGPIQIGTGSHPHEDSFPFYTPNFPRSKRLLRLAYPSVERRGGDPFTPTCDYMQPNRNRNRAWRTKETQIRQPREPLRTGREMDD